MYPRATRSARHRGHLGTDVGGHHLQQRLGREPLAGDRGHAEHGQRVRGKGLQPLPDQPDRGVGDGDLCEIGHRHPPALSRCDGARFGQQRERLFDRERVAAGSRGDGGVHSRLRGAEQVAHECGRLIGRQGSEADDGEPFDLSCGREDDQAAASSASR